VEVRNHTLCAEISNNFIKTSQEAAVRLNAKYNKLCREAIIEEFQILFQSTLKIGKDQHHVTVHANLVDAIVETCHAITEDLWKHVLNTQSMQPFTYAQQVF